MEVARGNEAGQGLEVKVAVTARQLQDVEAKHTVLLQEAQQVRQDIQKTQIKPQQALLTLQQGVSDALGGQTQGLAAIRQFQDSLGPMDRWATGVNTQLQGLNDAITGSRVWGSIQIRSSTVAGGSSHITCNLRSSRLRQHKQQRRHHSSCFRQQRSD